MKTKFALLLIAPALLLASCGSSKENEVSAEEAKTIETNIAAKTRDIKNYVFTVDSNSTSYDEDLDKNVTTKGQMELTVNENGEVYLHSKATSDTTTIMDFYLANDETYTKVMYTSYDYGDGEKDIECYGYVGHELEFGFSSLIYALPASYLELFKNPFTFEAEVTGKDDYEISKKYYSSGDDNLTIKVETKYTGDKSPLAEETAVEGSYEVKYVDGYFKSLSSSATSNKGNKSTLKFDLAVKDKVSITLPSGWKDIINQTSDDDE